MTNIQHPISNYQCVSCGTEYDIEPFRYQCDCGENLDYIYNYNLIKRSWSKQTLAKNPDRSHWRYLPLLPVKDAPKNPSIQVGGTPLISVEYKNVNRLWIKDDTRNPSGSLKDRASDIGIQHATKLGEETIVAASTGNAAASLAALSAFYGKKAVIIAPASAPKAKLTQILQYGATLILVKGSYDDAFDLSKKVVEKYGWYSRNTGINPVLSEGKKTVALEIAEQLNWKVPDNVFVPVGDGCIIGGVYKGFYDLLQLGWTSRIPKIIAVQAEDSAAIVIALMHDRSIEPVKAKTIADSISVDMPRDGMKAIRAVRKSGGFGVTVTDDEILSAQKDLASSSGIFAEPAASATYAGFLKALNDGKVKKSDEIVILITGSGLKDIPTAQEKISIPDPITPDLDHFKEAIYFIP